MIEKEAKREAEYRKLCPHCEEGFEAKRLNQVYCTSRCKYTANNRKRQALNRQHQRVNAILARNWLLLEQVRKQSGNKPVRINRQKLEALGYNFNYHTHHLTLSEEKTAYMQYNLGLVYMGNDSCDLYIEKGGSHAGG